MEATRTRAGRTTRSHARLARWLDAQISPFARATHRRRLRGMQARDGAASVRQARDAEARRWRGD
jgi:hypothetical protein